MGESLPISVFSWPQALEKAAKLPLSAAKFLWGPPITQRVAEGSTYDFIHLGRLLCPAVTFLRSIISNADLKGRNGESMSDSEVIPGLTWHHK